ncbi:hypothetical protein CN918_26425 [Priestia megaterium]|nr:hypothetical protein CN918_26425 [Priestia megaterium]
MSKLFALVPAWLIGNLSFQVALLISAFGIKGFSSVIESVLASQLYILYIIELLFLGIGFYIVYRHGTSEGWEKFMIGYTAGFIVMQGVLAILGIVFKVSLSDVLAAFSPYVVALVLGIVVTVHIKTEQTINRYLVFGTGGVITILIYDAIIKFWPSEWESFFQFIIFIPIIFLWIPYTQKEDTQKKDAI